MFRTEHDDLREKRSRIAGEVRAAMGRRNVNAASLAGLTGIPAATLSRKLNAHTSFTVDDLLDIADALDVSPADFFPARSAA